MDTQKIEAAVKMIIEAARRTLIVRACRKRLLIVARMYQKCTRSLSIQENNLSKSFEIIDDNNGGVEKDIFSTPCVVPLLALLWEAHIAYIPDGRVMTKVCPNVHS